MDDTMITGILLGIAVRRQPGAPMETLDRVSIDKEKGLKGDGREQSRRRQVTILSQRAWQEACDEISKELPWTTRRANLLVDGISLKDATGKIIKVGSSVLEITGETKPCHIMEAASTGLRAALSPSWRGGVTCRVLESGDVTVGDLVKLQS